MLSDFIARQLEKDGKLSKGTTVCSYSFSERKLTPEAFLRHMINQTLNGNKELCGPATEHWSTGSAGALKSWDSLWLFWTNICEKMKGGQIFWVIDALDECTDIGKMKDFHKRILALITTLNNIATSRLCCHILLTGRPEVCREIDARPGNRIILENESAIDDDIRTLINVKVQELAKSESLQEAEVEELKLRLHEGADRTFIWVALALETFENDLRQEAYDETPWAKAISNVALTLDGTYANCWSQLDYGSPGKTRDLLQFVLAGNGFFTVPELSVLLTLESCNNAIIDVEQKALNIRQFVQKSHGSFLRPVKRSDGLQQTRLVHETAKEHLIQTPKYSITMRDCHLQLAKRCIKHLVLADLDDLLDQIGSQEIESMSQEHPLLRYAILNWAFHLRESDSGMSDEEFVQDILSLYRNNSRRYTSWSRAYWRLSSRTDSKHDCTPLQMCTYNGHVRILEVLLGYLDEEDRRAKIDQKDTAGDTALHYAAECGRVGAVDILLKADANRNVRNKAGLTALHKAVECNEADVVTTLINGGVNIDVRTTGNEPRRTALHLAAGAGLLGMVKLLVEHGANIEIYDSVSLTAADQAFKSGHGQIQQFLLTKQHGSGTTEMDRAILEGDASRVKSLIRSGTHLDEIDSYGSTPLHSAARAGNEEIVRLVLKHTQAIEIQDDNGMTPLHIASRYGCRDAVEALLRGGAKVDTLSTDRSTPLHEAAWGGSDAIVKRLLDAQGDPASVDAKHRTPLFCASSLGYDQVVETLLANMKTEDVKNHMGRLPIHAAAKKGHTKIVERLVKGNARNIEISDRLGSTPLMFAANGKSAAHAETVRILIENGANVLHKRRDGLSAILCAARKGNEESVRYLLGEKITNVPPKAIDIDERDLRRSTPLSVAAAGGFEGIVLLLLRYGAKDVTKREGLDRRDPLSWAAGFGMIKAIEELLKIPGLNINSPDDHHRTPLSWAAGNGHAGTVLQLLGYNNPSTSKAVVDSTDIDGRTPLSWAAEAGHKDVIELLLKHRANPAIRSEINGGAPISWAAVSGHNEVLSLFLQYGEDVLETIHDGFGSSLLSLAAQHGKAKTVDFLLKRSTAEVNRVSRQGLTPLMLAADRGHEDVVELLVRRGADVHLTAPNQATPLHYLIKQGSWANINMLIKYDSNVLQAKTEEGETPLHLAVSQGSYGTIKLLLALSCDVAAKTPRKNDSVIHLAAKRGDFALMPLLLERAGQSINDQNADGETPLFIAAKNRDEQTFDYLLNYCLRRGIPLTSLLVRDRQQSSLLQVAAKGGSCPIVHRVLGLIPDNKLEIGHLNLLRLSPLTTAAGTDKGDVVRILLRHNLEVINDCDYHPEFGRSPLLWAAYFGDEETVEYLLTQSTLDQYKTNRRGHTSLWLASSQGHTGVVRLLLKAPTVDRQSRIAWLNFGDLVGENSPLHEAVELEYMEIVELLLTEPDLDIDRRNARKESAFLVAIITNQPVLFKLLAEDFNANTTTKDFEGQSALALAC